jgi:DNA polymerase-1
MTAKGNRSTSGESLKKHLIDRELYSVLQYRGPLTTCVHTFMESWLATAEASGGRIFTQWNQTKGEGIGTRTGRLSSTPNLQNIPTDLEQVNDDRPSWCPPLPLVRKYIIPSPGMVLLDRDFNSQELRVFAHYEDDKLAAQYHEDANSDIHQFVADMINAIGVPVTRKMAKTLNFLTLYGGGVGKLAMQLGTDVATATTIKNAYLAVFPALKAMNRTMAQRERDHVPITTWGGRKYLAEPPKMVNGRMMTFGYKLLNILIQGSSADVTKEAIIRYDAAKKHGRLLLNVHDQIVLECPEEHAKTEMALLKDAMDNIELDVPMLSSGDMG